MNQGCAIEDDVSHGAAEDAEKVKAAIVRADSRLQHWLVPAPLVSIADNSKARSHRQPDRYRGISRWASACTGKAAANASTKAMAIPNSGRASASTRQKVAKA